MCPRTRNWVVSGDLPVAMALVRLARQACALRNNLRKNPHTTRIPARCLTQSTAEQLEELVDDFGDYSIVLPSEPFVFGVSHIVPREVPKRIARPHYATEAALSGSEGSSPPLERRLVLGGEEEFHIREAAKLAKKVRDYAGTLVKVRTITQQLLG